MFGIPINMWAVLIGAFIHLILGALWHFSWFSIEGAIPEKKKSLIGPYISTFLSGFILSYVFGLIIGAFAPADIGESLAIGFLVWLGISLPGQFQEYFFLNRPLSSILINGAFFLSIFLILSLLFTL